MIIPIRDIIGWINEKGNEWEAKPTVIFYLAVAPQLAPGIAQKLSDQKDLHRPGSNQAGF